MTGQRDRGYEYFGADPGRGIHAWASTEADAFAQTALGVLALGVAPADVVDVDRREVRAQGTSPEVRLVNWVNECLYVHELEGFAVRRVEVDVCDGSIVHGVLHGEVLDPTRHRVGAGAKAARLAGTRVRLTPAGCDVVMIIDC